MPKRLHGKLGRRADQMALKGDRRDAYVYGSMTKQSEARKQGRSLRDSTVKQPRRKRRQTLSLG